jgi:hypothetical protein
LVAARREELKALLDGMLNAIKASLRARKMVGLRVKDTDGHVTITAFDVGPDHCVALKGAAAFLRLLPACG